jgi:hypothetical protein
LHYDQRWLDFAPSFVTDLHLIRDPGINLAYWNLPDINSSIDGGHFLVNGVPCRLFHFSGFNPEFPEDVSRYVPGLTMEELGPYATLYAQYREQLISMGHEQVSLIPWRWETFNNGARISLAARQHYRMMGDESQRFGDPFDAHSRSSYYRWFMGPKYFSLRIRRALRKYPRKIWEGLFNRMDRY